jgi:hypothetical protein
MPKSLLAGIAICTTLAVFAGNANADKTHAHKTHKTTAKSTAGTQNHHLASGTRVNTGPNGDDPLYKSCDEPWKHLAYACPGIGGGDGN